LSLPNFAENEFTFFGEPPEFHFKHIEIVIRGKNVVLKGFARVRGAFKKFIMDCDGRSL
jgi:hypothetical protein